MNSIFDAGKDAHEDSPSRWLRAQPAGTGGALMLAVAWCLNQRVDLRCGTLPSIRIIPMV